MQQLELPSEVYGRLGGQYLHYVRLPGSPGSTTQPAEDELVRSCLQRLGVQAGGSQSLTGLSGCP